MTSPLYSQTIEPPPTSPAPTSTASGGNRPIQTCLNRFSNLPGLVALTSSHRIGFTRSSQPTILIYLPDHKAQLLEFSLFNAQKQGLYQTTLPTHNQSGLIEFPFPSDAPTLVKGQNYYWTVAVVCNAHDRTEDQVVSGWIQYRDLPQTVAQLSPLERIELYARQGFWYDAFSEWKTLSQKQPGHPAIKQAWSNLMRSIGLPPSLMPY